jgi:cysteine desulfurase
MKHTPVYLDYAAATPVLAEVFDAMWPYYAEKFYNPSALYLAAEDVKKDLETARGTVAGLVGVRPSEVVFTAGGTEANNLAIKGVMEQFPGAKVLVSAIEHESVLKPAEEYNHTLVSVDQQGIVDLSDLAAQLDDQTVLISVMCANNEVGSIQPIRKIAEFVQTVRTQRRQNGNELPLYLHTDACQAGNYLDLHVSRLGVDIMTINGGKIYGPKQSGALCVLSTVRLHPQIVGGGQERNQRSGTENVPQIAGFAKALELAQTTRKDSAHAMQELQVHFIKQLTDKFPEVIVNGSMKHRLPNNVHITLPRQDNERLIFALDEAGIQAAAGSACSASNEEPSHVLRAMGVSEDDARSSLRLTMGKNTTTQDIDYVVEKLADIAS